jgi:hypothetical protein
LRSLECLAAKFAFVRLERDVHTNMGGDVVTLDGGGTALAPGAGEVQVVGRLAADMSLADVVLQRLVSTTAHLLKSSRVCDIRRGLLQRRSARRSLATGIAGSRLLMRLTMTAAQWGSEADLAGQGQSLVEQQVARLEGFECSVRSTCCRCRRLALTEAVLGGDKSQDSQEPRKQR